MINIRCDKFLYISFFVFVMSEIFYIIVPSYSVILMFSVLSMSVFILFLFYRCFKKNKNKTL